MLRQKIQTLIWKYDKYMAAAIAVLPASWQPYSAKLGRVTLPSIWAAALIIVALIFLANGYKDLAVLTALVIACIPIGSIMKLIVRRSRPKTIYAENMKIKSYSFPSSHTYAATLAGGYLALLCFTIFAVPINLLFGGMIVILVVAIGLSRVHVGAHYPTDVTAGWLLGVIILAIIAHSTVLFMHL